MRVIGGMHAVEGASPKAQRARRWLIGLLAIAMVAAACSGDDDDAGSEDTEAEQSETPTTEGEGDEGGDDAVVDPYDGHTSANYDDPTNWICHPDKPEDECRDLSATALAPDGSTSPADLAVAEDPPIDCFYVYPTASTDTTQLADFAVDNSELSTIRAQAAPFASTCRVFAPAYRQISISGLGGGFEDADAWATAHGDVVDAWKTYISQHNDGRGVVLIGHSQGSGHLNDLVDEEIVANPELQERLVSAILLGGSTEAVGFDGIPPCDTADQVGCVIAFVSYPAAAPPTSGAIFGSGGALCVDPTDLTGNETADVIVPSELSLLGGVDLGLQVDTRYVVLPDALTLSCTQAGDYSFLAVGPAEGWDPARISALTFERLGPTWGLHLLDANLAMGDLLEVVAAQANTFAEGD